MNRLNIYRQFLVVDKRCYASITYDRKKIDIASSRANAQYADEAETRGDLNLSISHATVQGSLVKGEEKLGKQS